MSQFELIIGNKNYSSWSLRAWLLMKKSGVDFKEQLIPLSTANTAQVLKTACPAGRVPVLHHDGLVIWDSLAIAEYLAEVFPEKHFWPEQCEARAWARSICAEMHAGFTALRSELPMNCRRPVAPWPLSAAVQQDVQRIDALWVETRQRFAAQSGWLFGEFTIADAFYAPVAMRFYNYAVALSEPAAAYVQQHIQDADIQEWRAAGSRETEVIAGYEK